MLNSKLLTLCEGCGIALEVFFEDLDPDLTEGDGIETGTSVDGIDFSKRCWNCQVLNRFRIPKAKDQIKKPNKKIPVPVLKVLPEDEPFYPNNPDLCLYDPTLNKPKV